MAMAVASIRQRTISALATSTVRGHEIAANRALAQVQCLVFLLYLSVIVRLSAPAPKGFGQQRHHRDHGEQQQYFWQAKHGCAAYGKDYRPSTFNGHPG